MNSEAGSYRSFDKYGMPLCPRDELVQTDKCSSNENILAKRSEKAMVLSKRGKYCEALRIFEDILKKRIVTLGHDHKDTCETRDYMAYLHLRWKEYDKAYKLHYQLNRAFNDRCDLIFRLYHEGQHEIALRFSQIIYNQVKLEPFPRKSEVLKIRTMIANIYAAMNKYREAMQSYEAIYYSYFHSKGPDHPDALTILRKMGIVLTDQGKFNEALDIFKDVLDKRKIILGHEHEDTLISHKDIAELLIKIGKYDKALDILLDVYAVERKIRPEHPAILETRCAMAKILSIRGLYKEALYILSEVYEIQRKNQRNLDISATMNLAAEVLIKRGKPREALSVYWKLYETQKKTNHPVKLDTEKNIAIVLLKLKVYDDAHEIFKSLYQKFCEIFGPTHTKTLEIQSRVAEIFALKDEYNQALTIFHIIYEIQRREDFLGPDHPDTLQTKHNIAKIFVEQGKYEEALGIYKEVLERKSLILNAYHLEVLDTECDIANVYRIQTKYNKSFQTYYSVYEKRAQVFGNLHEDTLAVKRIMDTISEAVLSENLLIAVHRNELQEVKACVEKGDDINVRDIDGSVALHLASKQGYVEIIEYLLDKGAIYNVTNRKGNKAVDVAKNDDVKQLFSAVEALFEAIKCGSYNLAVRLIHEKKASINAKDTSGCTPLHWAAFMGCKKTVSFLLKKGSDFTLLTKNGNTVLHLAVSRHFKDIAEILLQFIKVNYPGKLDDFINAKTMVLGTTSLHCASQNDDYRTVKLLLHYGAETRIKNKLGKFPLDLTTKDNIKSMLLTRDTSLH